MVGAELRGDRARVRRLRVGSFVEHYAERPRWLANYAAGQSDHRTGVDATGKKHTQGYVADEVQTNRLFQLRSELCDCVRAAARDINFALLEIGRASCRERV